MKYLANTLVVVSVVTMLSQSTMAQTNRTAAPPRRTSVNSNTTARGTTADSPNRGRATQPARQPSSASQPLGPAPRGTHPTARQTNAVPRGFDLTLEQQQRVFKILKFWESFSESIKTFECEFERWEYDPVWGPKDKTKPARIAVGEIKFATPDKGLSRDKRIVAYQPTEKPGESDYKDLDKVNHEYWLCDGDSVYFANPADKVMIEQDLPSELKGKAISEGPLPFIFGAKAESMLKKYWIREATPKEAQAKGEYWLEAIPRNQADLANFQRIIVIMDQPKKGQLMPREMRVTKRLDQQGHTYHHYKFKDRQINSTMDRLAAWRGAFVKPEIPKGWTLKKESFDGSDQSAPRTADRRNGASANAGSRPAQPAASRANRPNVQPRR